MSKPAWATSARTGELFRHKQLVFFACEGLIALYDQRTPAEDYSILLPGDIAERARELNRYAAACLEPECSASMREEGRICRKGANDMLAAVREARDMGDPSDPAVRAFWARHRNIGRATTVSLRPGSDADGYPALPDVDLGPRTGKTVKIDGRAVPVPAETHLRLHRPPRRKNRAGLILDV